MAFIPVINGVQLVIGWEGTTSQEAKIILGVEFDAPATLGSLAELLTHVYSFITDQMVIPWSLDFAIKLLRAYGLDTPTSPTLDATPGSDIMPEDIQGTIDSPLVSDALAVVNTMQSGIRGRSFRGRNFWPGVPTSYMQTPSELTGEAVAAWDTFVDAIIGSLSAAGTPLVIISRHSGGAPRSEGIMTPVADCRTQAKLGVQKRRRQGTF